MFTPKKISATLMAELIANQFENYAKGYYYSGAVSTTHRYVVVDNTQIGPIITNLMDDEVLERWKEDIKNKRKLEDLSEEEFDKLTDEFLESLGGDKIINDLEIPTIGMKITEKDVKELANMAYKNTKLSAPLRMKLVMGIKALRHMDEEPPLKRLIQEILASRG